MLISFYDGIVETTNCKVYAYADMKIYLQGIVFIPGFKANEESIEAIAKMYCCGNIDFNSIYGAYVIAIQRSNEEIVVFSDNSHMHCVYIGDKCIASSLLQVMQHEETKELDLFSVAEYLSVVRSVCARTLAKGVVLGNTYSYYVIKQGQLCEFSKNIGDITSPSSVSGFEEFFNKIAYSFSDVKCIAALTGGFDSRLVVAQLKNKLQLDTFISGDEKTKLDVVVSKQVADKANVKWMNITPSLQHADEETVIGLFSACDGQFDNATEDGYRVQYFFKRIEDMGYKVLFTGEAGDMHKELWYMQDFPFYRKKTTGVEAFYKKRIEVIPYWKYLTDAGKEMYVREKQCAIERMNGLVKGINSESYDAFGYDVVWNKSAMHNQFFTNVTIYNPLQELDLVRYSYHEPRRRRFFNYNIRVGTTSKNKEMARVKTTYGTTSSSEPLYIFLDAFRQMKVYSKKFIKLRRKQTGVEMTRHNQTLWEKEIRALDISQHAINTLKQMNILPTESTPVTLPAAIINKAIYIYLLYRHANARRSDVE